MSKKFFTSRAGVESQGEPRLSCGPKMWREAIGRVWLFPGVRAEVLKEDRKWKREFWENIG